MSSELALRAENISKSYQIYPGPWSRLLGTLGIGRRRGREFKALAPLSFEVGKGEFLAIIGENGSGKSTMLQLLTGILIPDTGEIETNGRIAALLELGAGFNPEFTGRENAVLNAQLIGIPAKAIAALFPKIEAFADIGAFIDEPVKTYSSGMFVRLAFAVQTCLDPDILIIDEALAVGDVFFRLKCYQRLEQLRARGCTIILVTHSMEDVLHHCDRAILLHRGRMEFIGRPDEAVSRYYARHDAGSIGGVLGSAETTGTHEGFVDEMPGRLDDWPVDNQFTDATGMPQVGDQRVTCLRFTVRDERGTRRRVFQLGETMSIFSEYRVDEAIGVPCAGVVMRTDKGVIIHGRNTAQSDRTAPTAATPGMILRARHSITLDVGAGEYVCNLGLASWPHAVYITHDKLSMAEIEQTSSRHCVLPDALSFSVVPNPGSGFAAQPFYGLAGLRSSCALETYREADDALREAG
jgi:lipopolysaccharide transport system ATP-binding protein